ncbi:MAG TPA: hypothetical protein VI790_05345, partial [Candidatus Nanoarchaeia archaeon]|nr:hypothetical protein [Candidatus Nanoarchaeia archaeon]
MRLIDETLEELIEEEEEILTSVSESDLKRLYNSKPELKDLFDSVLSGQAGLSHKYTVMELIKSLNNEELTLTPEKPFLQCNDNLTDNVNEIKSLSFNYYLLQYVFKQLLKNGECTIGYIDNAIESVSKSSKQEFKNLIRACKDVSIKEFFNNLELKIRGSYESPLKGKLINKVIQLRKAVKPFINELFESTNKVPISEYYKMSYVTDLIVKGLNHIPTGVIPWNNSYIKANKSLRLLQDCI